MKRRIPDLSTLLPALEDDATAETATTPAPCPPRKAQDLVVPLGRFDPELGIRSRRVAHLNRIRSCIKSLARELRQLERLDPEKSAVHAELRRLNETVDVLSTQLSDNFLPEHSETQLIGPGIFLATRLFNVRGKNIPREREVSFLLSRAGVQCTYEGPELRQQDGYVFMALLNAVREYSTKTTLAFEPSAMCHRIFGRYDGKTRNRLSDSIWRLMKGLIRFPEYTVHLVERFEHPTTGKWSVKLDESIVSLFKKSQHVWLDIETRRALPEGLATWLYGYVRTQVRLIPTTLSALRELSGSETADDTNFKRRLTEALDALVRLGIIDAGWSIRDGCLRWRKFTEQGNSGATDSMEVASAPPSPPTSA